MSAPLLPWLDAALEQALRPSTAHALLIDGPQGVGQFELAMAIVAAWLCEADPDQRDRGRACGHCAGCRLLQSRTHPDLKVLLPEALREALGWEGGEAASVESEGGKSKAKPSREIKVEALRDAVAFAQQTAARGRGKVVLIHPAERMNAIAANTLLKTLEEPPGALRFVLSSNAAQRLLPTVRSRCQVLRLPLPPAEPAVAWLAGQGIDAPEVLLAAAGGRPLEVIERRALGIDAARWKALPADVAAGRGEAFTGWPLPVLIDALQKLVHDVAACSVGGTPRYFAPAALPAGADLAALTACAAALRRAARQAEHPWHAGLATESLILQVRHALRAVALAGGEGPVATLRA